MKELKATRRSTVIALATTPMPVAGTAACGASAKPPSDWQHGVMIYGWLPSISGDLKYHPPDAEVSLMYRYPAYDQGDDKLLEDIAFGGGMLGVAFRF